MPTSGGGRGFTGIKNHHYTNPNQLYNKEKRGVTFSIGRTRVQPSPPSSYSQDGIHAGANRQLGETI